MHGSAQEHALALRYMFALAKLLDAKTILDVGSGTGRAVKFFLDQGLEVRGVEPVPALIQQAVDKHQIPPGTIIPGSGDALPFPDASFDLVCETGVLHHVAQPTNIVEEMVRVARKAVCISDENRFGVGGPLSGVFHYLLYQCRLWPAYRYARTLGKNYSICPEDGVRYSYSVYESLEPLVIWSDDWFMIPTKSPREKTYSWFQPLFTASHVLCCAVKNKTAWT
jgi:ubiquinone/menaquinone biosynthesis C-methylase UbiE